MRSVAFDPESEWLLTASSDRTARIWETEGPKLREWARIDTQSRKLNSAIWSRDGKWIWTAAREFGGIRRWPACEADLLQLARERSQSDSAEEDRHLRKLIESVTENR